MRGVKHHRITSIGHNRQAAKITDQSVIAKGGAPVAEQNSIIAGAGDFIGHILHIPRRQKLAFFHVDCAACFSRRQKQIGLPA